MTVVALDDASSSLEHLGFTQYEAKVFAGLTALGSSSVSGLYSTAGVPRSAVYGALKSLVDRGLVEVSQGKPAVYHAIPPEQAMSVITREFEAGRGDAQDALESVKGRGEPELGRPEMMWFMKGPGNIMAKVTELVKGAGTLVFIGMKAEHMRPFEGILKKSSRRGVRVAYLAMENLLGSYGAVESFAEPVVLPRHDGPIVQPNMGFIYVDGRTAIVISFSDRGGIESAFYTNSEEFLSFIQMALSSFMQPRRPAGRGGIRQRKRA